LFLLSFACLTASGAIIIKKQRAHAMLHITPRAQALLAAQLRQITVHENSSIEGLEARAFRCSGTAAASATVTSEEID